MNDDMDLQSGLAAFEAKEFTRAIQLLSPLADKGNAEAQYRLGMMFHKGLCRVVNEEAAVKGMTAASASCGTYCET